eukprot:27000-Eustigmatos_ZCMA.PRE.1
MLVVSPHTVDTHPICSPIYMVPCTTLPSSCVISATPAQGWLTHYHQHWPRHLTIPACPIACLHSVLLLSTHHPY